MVDFQFDIRPLFPQPIVKVTSNLLPNNFRGDHRQRADAARNISTIIDRLGELSAVSQGLTKPVTTAQRLRMNDNQTIYLLADTEAAANGAVLGMLKVGTKDLYLFDEKGQTRKMEKSPSILDFYVHETRQRMGMGKRLFETMLDEEQWTPLKCSVDRPSEKLLGFLGKHYGLIRTIPQANNFVLFEGFFNNDSVTANGSRNGHDVRLRASNSAPYLTNSPNTQLFGATYLGDEANMRAGRVGAGSQQQLKQQQTVLLQQITQISPNGRYGARRPTCSMAESRKCPLDALSRTNYRQDPFQRRSGLQDVDDSFLANNAFARPSRVRQSPSVSGNSAVAPIRVASGQESPQMQYQQQPLQPANAQQQQLPPQPTQIPQQAMQSQVPSMAPPQAQIQQQPPQAAQPQQQQQPIPTQQSMQSQQQQPPQQYVQQPAAGQPSRHEPYAGGRSHGHHQQAAYDHHGQSEAQPQSQMQQQQAPAPASPRKYQQQQQQQNVQQQGYIIHAGGANSGKGGGGGGSAAESSSGSNIAEITAQLQNLQTDGNDNEHYSDPEPESEPEPEPVAEPEEPISPPQSAKTHTSTPPTVRSPEQAESIIGDNRRAPAFQLSKQHTGMKNRSFGVGMAVMPTSKMEFNQSEREDFGVVKLNRPLGNEIISPGQDNTDAMSTVSSTGGLTDQGYNDLKFYHNRLW